MLLDSSEIETIAVQLVDVNGSNMTAKTENNDLIQIKPNAILKNDKSFWQSMKDIAKAKIWLPVTKGTHQLLQYDWLSATPVI
ncbi:hypothetical protein HC026_03595 [Lactobacillus sp. LC28-10]|uniref:Uncharacterized protein n=1 Tax=Secundilactobacillus angelensis TaxID=2722706 RepID=A0ABX1KWM1_9LACO|nr:hypothetical protein [Secundilactobacillus angelensis]MCH5461708.1 hypothetical protein [Secundilactobacillus angelensis]NLR18004.1 hypothetical protein [Secundilactobacillus angelensis]